MATARKALVNIGLHEFTVKSFGRALKTDVAGVVMQEAHQHAIDKTTFIYTIPPSLCHVVPHNNAQDFSGSGHVVSAGYGKGIKEKLDRGVMGVGAVLAVFDELSTYALMMKDTHARPGVSVFLSADIVEDIPADSRVSIESHAVKVGKSLGFCEVEMRAADSDHKDLLARGTHIKYLPMGRLWDCLATPSILPWVVRGYQWMKEAEKSGGWVGKILQARKGERKYGDDVGDSVAMGAVYESLALKPLHSLPQEEKSDNKFELRILPFMKNLGGTLHGGAVAMAAEKAALASNEAVVLGENSPRIRAMQVQYLSAVLGNDVIISTHSTHRKDNILQDTRGEFTQQQRKKKKPKKSEGSSECDQEIGCVRATYQCSWSE